MKPKRKCKRIFSILIIVFISCAVYIPFDICVYSHVDEKTKADAAIVLGAGVWGDEPSPIFQERINHAIWLYQNGYVDKIIFTGGKGESNASEACIASNTSEACIARKYAIENLIPEEDIFIEEQSTITQENIIYAKKIADENNISTVIIVSDPLHMKRAMLMAKDYGFIAYSSPTPTTRYRSFKTKARFLAREVYYYTGYLVVRLFER